MRAVACVSSGCGQYEGGGSGGWGGGDGTCTRRGTIQAAPSSPLEAHMAELNFLCLDWRARTLLYFLACPLYVGVN